MECYPAASRIHTLLTLSLILVFLMLEGLFWMVSLKIVITIFSTTRSSIFGRECKAEEVHARVVTESNESSSDLPPNAICYHCGKPGHLKFNLNTKLACSSTVCSVCKAHMGDDNHNAQDCCKDSALVFSNDARSFKKKPVGRGRKPAATRGRSSSSTCSRPNH